MVGFGCVKCDNDSDNHSLNNGQSGNDETPPPINLNAVTNMAIRKR